MNDLSIQDMVVMIESTPKPRQHGANLDVIKTLYDKEFNYYLLITGFIAPLSIALVSVLITIGTDALTKPIDEILIAFIIRTFARG